MVDFGKRCTRNIEEEPAFSTPPTKTNFDPAYVSFATPQNQQGLKKILE